MQFLDRSYFLWRVWKAATRASLIREMEFRGNFIAGLVRQILWLGAFLIMIEVIFANTNSLGGWVQSEVLVIIALSRIIEALINSLFAQNIMELPREVRDGKFDFYLTKPVPVQFYTAFRKTGIDNMGSFVAGIALLIYVSITSGVVLFENSFIAFLLIACGITIYYSLLILASTLVFFLERLEFLWGFHMLISEPLTVPFEIFPRLPRTALTYLLPLAFVVFVPAQALTGRLQWWQVPVSILIAAIFLVLANLAWRAGLRRYSSASS